MRKVIRAAVQGGFIFALVVPLLIGILSFQINKSLVENQDTIMRGQEALTGLDELLVEVLEAESAARGFVIAGEKYFQDPYYLTTQVDTTVARLRTLLSDNPKQRQQLDSLSALIAEKLAFHRRMIELRRSSGEQAAVQLFLTGRGQVLRDEIQDRVDAMGDEETRVLSDRTTAARRASDRSVLTLVVGSVLSFGILLLVYLNLDREVARRRQSEQKLLQLNRLYAVLTRTSESIVRIRERDALFRAVCRIAVEDGLFRMAWVGTVNSPDRGDRTGGLRRVRRRLPEANSHHHHRNP
jgi:CHASE3 domain sensor protein